MAVGLIAGVFLGLAGGGASYGFWIYSGRFATVEAGVLYRSARIAPDALVRRCKMLGVRTVIDLQQPGETHPDEAAALAAAGIRYVHVPSGQVPAPEAVSAFLAVMGDARHHPVLVHCRHGVGRAGVMSAIYRMEFEGDSNESVLRQARLLSGFDSFGAGTPKEVFLREYTPGNRIAGRPDRVSVRD